jgi:hypothetical protein
MNSLPLIDRGSGLKYITLGNNIVLIYCINPTQGGNSD